MSNKKPNVIGWIVLAVLALVALGSCQSCMNQVAGSQASPPWLTSTPTQASARPLMASPAAPESVAAQEPAGQASADTGVEESPAQQQAQGDPNAQPNPNPQPNPHANPQPARSQAAPVMPQPRETSAAQAQENAPAVHYKSCAEVSAAGKAPLHRGDPGYDENLDRDGDGTACEKKKG